MKLAYSHRAERDLEEIGNRIALDNPDRAESFIIELRAACEGLRQFPLRFPRARRYSQDFIRQRAFQNYLIIYAVTSDVVTVIHIGHGSREI